MKALVLADLDDTLFQTRRKVPAGVPERDLVVASALADGTPSGYSTPVQRALLELLAGATLVPVTARSREALGRTTVAARPAVCANGGCIVDADGRADPEWHAHLSGLAAGGTSVEEVFARLDRACADLDVRRWIVAEDGLGLYAVAKENGAGTGEALGALVDGPLGRALPAGWRVHLNGNNLALSPPWLAKRAAVAHLLPRLLGGRADVPVVGLGDSLSDAGFMDLCHFALAPTGSQLWGALAAASPWVPSGEASRAPAAGASGA